MSEKKNEQIRSFTPEQLADFKKQVRINTTVQNMRRVMQHVRKNDLEHIMWMFEIPLNEKNSYRGIFGIEKHGVSPEQKELHEQRKRERAEARAAAAEIAKEIQKK